MALPKIRYNQKILKARLSLQIDLASVFVPNLFILRRPRLIMFYAKIFAHKNGRISKKRVISSCTYKGPIGVCRPYFRSKFILCMPYFRSKFYFT
ncbi:MAG: hypothetical protein DRR00_21475 [Candidatus Parabeggiatoa sp. nov. 3]|nr:MAG: hypothetical protein DRR00_21475 [Gammaproteobacteria bacterium]